MKESKYFRCKKEGHIAYDYPRKEKIIGVSENVNKDNDNQ